MRGLRNRWLALPNRQRGTAAGRRLTFGALVAIAGACGVSDPNVVLNIGGSAGAHTAGGQLAGGTNATDGGEPAEGLGGVPGASGGTPAHAGTGGTAGSNPGAGTGGGVGSADACDAISPDECLDLVAGKKSDFGIPWKSSWFLMGCKEKQAHECVSMPSCPFGGAAVESKGAITIETFPIGGTPGHNYKVTFKFNAVAGGKEISNGTRDAGGPGTPLPTDLNTALHDSFHRDGTSPESNYDPWKLTVFDDSGAEARHYYMNSFPSGWGAESHRLFLLSYTKSIVVVGGGTVQFMVQDKNCHSIDNCGPGDIGSACPAARSLPNEPTAVLPTMYKDPADQTLKATVLLNLYTNTTAQPWHSQYGHFTVTAVEKTSQLPTHDFP